MLRCTYERVRKRLNKYLDWVRFSEASSTLDHRGNTDTKVKQNSEATSTFRAAPNQPHSGLRPSLALPLLVRESTA
jgi:hypothetical protein